ncbi:MAG TPA: FAD binding domain-containing protein [Stellaceae bacterium]|nr:FAD binding domain-containing protein [Stellaceae bacterium]
MDLNTIQSVLLPRTRAELPAWAADTAVLGGGTWLFSEPQPDLHRLVDLAALGWANLVVDAEGLHIAGTCGIAALSRFVPPPGWRSADLIGRCCEALLGSFKVWNAATVGGNICLALPAGPMTALAAALGGIATLWCPDGSERHLPVVDLVRGDRRTALAEGEILRSVLLPLAALQDRSAFRQMSLTPLGRSGILLIGTRDCAGGFALTLTAATTRPIRLAFAAPPSQATLAARIDTAVSGPGLWHDDMHGDPAWRRHISLLFAEEIRQELVGP